KNEDNMDQILGYLHDLGVCLHFNDDPILKHYVILKPEWGTSAVYGVIDHTPIADRFGRFTMADLRDVWSDEQYNRMHDQLLQLMIRFKLCYQIPNSPVYIAPQLLNANQPKYDWDVSNNLVLRYEYEFMPKGIITRLIVAMHEHIDDDIVWKTGVVLRMHGAYAEVKENYKGNEITIRVIGNERERLFQIISYEIDKLNDSFEHIEVNKQIPCGCIECRDSETPHFWEYSYVFKLVKAQMSVLCPKSEEAVDPAPMLKEIHMANQHHREMMAQSGQPSVYIDKMFTSATQLGQNFEGISGEYSMEDNSQDNSVHAGRDIKDSPFKNTVQGDLVINHGVIGSTQDDPLRDEIKQLLQQLETELNKVDPSQKEIAEEVQEYANDAAELAAEEKPRKRKLESTGNMLKEAAQNLLEVTPIAVEIAKKLLLLA
ncbi:MAG: COR domain-containing protein, partial [Chloroflexota bacterium]